MTPNEERLLEVLRTRSYVEGDVVLASGARSDYYIDGKMIEVNPEGAYLIGEAIYERTRGLKFDAIGGLAVGAVPVVTSAVISYHVHEPNRGIEGFWVREEAKAHGTTKKVEGGFADGMRVVIVDDVITSGQSAEKAVIAVRSRGAVVVKVITLVDRLSGASEKFADMGLVYEPIFTTADLRSRSRVLVPA